MPACSLYGRRVPRGQLRWYLAHTPAGAEQQTCAAIRRIISADLLEDAFVMQREKWMKLDGAWGTHLVQVFPEYIFVATRDAGRLDRAFARLSFPVRLSGALDGSFAPLAREAQAFFERTQDDRHVLRSSMAEIVDGELRVLAGPLCGQESLVRKIDRHKRRCLVHVSDSQGGFDQQLALEVPVVRSGDDL